jgi:hypothetical protein
MHIAYNIIFTLVFSKGSEISDYTNNAAVASNNNNNNNNNCVGKVGVLFLFSIQFLGTVPRVLFEFTPYS